MSLAGIEPAQETRPSQADLKRPTRVLHCLWGGAIGGAERAVHLLVREQLTDPSLEPAFLFARSGGLYWERAQSLGCSVTTLELPHGRAVHKIPSIALRMSGVDIHHFHSAEPLLMLASATCSDVRRVYTHRGGIIDYSPLKRLQYEAAGVLLRRTFHGFSGNSAHGARSGERLFRLPEHRFQTTYNGIDFGLIDPRTSRAATLADLGIPAGALVVGTAANLKDWKRIDRLIDLIAELPPGAHLIIVGDGPERQRLQAHCNSRGVASQVVFVGRQNRPWDYVQAMDVFCLPSMGLESFGNAAVESMALGIPTIVFADGGGLVEHIEDRQTGFIVSTREDLRRVVLELWGDPELRSRVGDQGRLAVRERYTSARAAVAYRTLYHTALHATASSGRR